MDVAAQQWNTKIPDRWFGPDIDGLAQSWRGERAWCNPPYGAANIVNWLAKATIEAAQGTTTVLLLPNTTDVKWFHRFVWDVQSNRARPGVELRFLKAASISTGRPALRHRPTSKAPSSSSCDRP